MGAFGVPAFQSEAESRPSPVGTAFLISPDVHFAGGRVTIGLATAIAGFLTKHPGPAGLSLLKIFVKLDGGMRLQSPIRRLDPDEAAVVAVIDAVKKTVVVRNFTALAKKSPAGYGEAYGYAPGPTRMEVKGALSDRPPQVVDDVLDRLLHDAVVSRDSAGRFTIRW